MAARTKKRTRPEADLVDEIPADLADQFNAEPDPEAAPEEPPAPEAPVIASQHAEHMHLEESSGIIAAPAMWLFIFLDAMIWLAGAVLAAVALTQPTLRVTYGSGALLSALAGGAVLFAILQGRKRFVAACASCEFDIKRSVRPDNVTYGDLVEATLDASECVFPDSLYVAIRDRPNGGFELGRNIVLEGPEIVTYPARATRRGDQAWSLVDVLMKDPGSMWRHTRTYAVDAHVRVDPGMASLTLRNMLNSRTAFPDGAPKALVHLFRDVEHDQLREYRGGDRMRDVDWKRMSATGQMMTKDRIVESLNVGLLLIDAGTSMRLADQGKRNLDHALEGASEIILEAGRRNHQIGVLAFDDERVIAELAPTRSRMLYTESQKVFQVVADRHAEHDKASEPVAVSLQRALRKMAGSQMGVLLFTDLETIDEGVIQVMARLGGDGAKVGVMVLPQPSMDAKRRAYRKSGVRPAAGNYRGMGHRRELREVLSIQGIETMDLPT